MRQVRNICKGVAAERKMVVRTFILGCRVWWGESEMSVEEDPAAGSKMVLHVKICHHFQGWLAGSPSVNSTYPPPSQDLLPILGVHSQAPSICAPPPTHTPHQWPWVPSQVSGCSLHCITHQVLFPVCIWKGADQQLYCTLFATNTDYLIFVTCCTITGVGGGRKFREAGMFLCSVCGFFLYYWVIPYLFQQK